MSIAKWFVPIACVAATLGAQGINDVNGLVSAANHYVSSGMAASRDPQPLGLYKLLGNYSDQAPNTLMGKASDVLHWTFLYKIDTTGQESLGPGDCPTAPAKPHVAVTAECTKGVFHDFHYSDKPVTGLKSLENTWLAVNLDAAVATLNANGYVRGFTSVSVERPDLANWPDDLVYVFNCPYERRQVGISCQTGALLWTYAF
jgi:hypothetical protein